MPNERTIPSDAPKTVVTATVLSNGTQVSQSFHLLSMHIYKEINRIPGATLVYSDVDPASQSFSISNAITAHTTGSLILPMANITNENRDQVNNLGRATL